MTGGVERGGGGGGEMAGGAEEGGRERREEVEKGLRGGAGEAGAKGEHDRGGGAGRNVHYVGKFEPGKKMDGLFSAFARAAEREPDLARPASCEIGAAVDQQAEHRRVAGKERLGHRSSLTEERRRFHVPVGPVAEQPWHDRRGPGQPRRDPHRAPPLLWLRVRVPPPARRRWVSDSFLAAGSSEREAELTSRHLVGANLAGHDSHGVGMVPRYVNSLLADELQLNRHVTVAQDSGTLLVLDEAYVDFAPDGTAAHFAPDDPSVIRLRTFSKA